MRVKRVPPFDFFGQNLFLTLLSKVDVKKKFMKISEFYRKILSQNVSKLSQNEEKQLTLPYDFCIFEIGKCSFLGKTIGKLTFSIKCSFIGISSKYLQNFRNFGLLEKLTDFETWFHVLEHSFTCFVNNYEEDEREEAHSMT